MPYRFVGKAIFSYPLSSRWLIGSKLLGGYVHYPQLKLTDRLVPARNVFCFRSGILLTFKGILWSLLFLIIIYFRRIVKIVMNT